MDKIPDMKPSKPLRLDARAMVNTIAVGIFYGQRSRLWTPKLTERITDRTHQGNPPWGQYYPEEPLETVKINQPV